MPGPGRAVRVVVAVFVAVAVLAVAAPVAAAETIAAKADVVVELDAGAVDVVVEGWSKKRVEVSADLPSGFRATLVGSGARVSVRLEGIGVPASGSIALKLPKRGELDVRSHGGDVTATGLAGAATVVTVNGDIDLRGAPTRVEVATVSGDVEVSGANGRVEASTVSGTVVLAAARGEARVETVSGNVTLLKAKLDRTSLASVSGAVALQGALRKGPHTINAHTGDVVVRISAKQAVRLKATSFSGKILDALADRDQTARGSYEQAHGTGGPKLTVATFSGDITFAR